MYPITTSSLLMAYGLLERLVPTCCFGPFPSQYILAQTVEIDPIHNLTCSTGRKRRRCEMNDLSFFSSIPSIPLTVAIRMEQTAPTNYEDHHGMQQHPNLSPPLDLDLNRTLNAPSEPEISEDCSLGLEAQKAVEIGK